MYIYIYIYITPSFLSQVKSDYYHDEQRLKVSCQSYLPLNVLVEGQRLLHEIRDMHG